MHAVVLGGGLAGLLAAAVLADRPEIDRVTVLERDELPDRPADRRGLPQGHHAHVLMSSGARVIESLVPGVTAGWYEAGAHRLGLPSGYVMLLAQGWLRRWETDEFVISCTRATLDHVLRQRVLQRPKISLVCGVPASGLLGDAGRVTGVRAGDEDLAADLVIDATGRGSRAPRWLAALGVHDIAEEVIDSGLRYATRIFRAPPGAERFPVVNIQAVAGGALPGQTAALMPVEGGRWLVTLSGTRGGEPPSGDEEFAAFARSMRHPVVADLIAGAEPLGPVRTTNSTLNRRRRFDRATRWPRGLIVLGDALASFNPVYGHGMSVAAKQADILRTALDRWGLSAGLAEAVQCRAMLPAAEAWAHAAGSDIRFPDVRGGRPSTLDRVLWRYQDRLFRTALTREPVAAELIKVFSLTAPARLLLRPRMVLAALRGPSTPPPPDPPFTAAESAVLHRTAS